MSENGIPPHPSAVRLRHRPCRDALRSLPLVMAIPAGQLSGAKTTTMRDLDVDEKSPTSFVAVLGYARWACLNPPDAASACCVIRSFSFAMTNKTQSTT